MRKYEVTEGHLSRAAVKELRRQGTRGQKPSKWESSLVWTCCNAFGAKPLWAAGPKGLKVEGYWTFIGPEGSIDLVDYTYVVLVRQLLKARAAYAAKLGGRGWTRVRLAAELDAFCEGYAHELSKKVEAVTVAPEVQERVDSIVDPSRPVVQPTNNGKGSVTALIEGSREGKTAHFHRPMTAAKQGSLT